MERAKGLEPSTSTLARWRSTTELRPRWGEKDTNGERWSKWRPEHLGSALAWSGRPLRAHPEAMIDDPELRSAWREERVGLHIAQQIKITCDTSASAVCPATGNSS